MTGRGRMVSRSVAVIATTAAAIGGLALAGCTATAQEGGGNPLRNFLLYGGSTVPPSAELPADDVYCPTVGVLEGGAAIQASTGRSVGEAGAVRHQIALGQLARECAGRPDGSVVVKVGVEGRALAGLGGSAGRFDVPVRFVLRQGNRVLAERVRRASVVIPPGDSQGSFALVEEGLLVPAASAQDFEILVGLGGAASRARRG